MGPRRLDASGSHTPPPWGQNAGRNEGCTWPPLGLACTRASREGVDGLREHAGAHGLDMDAPPGAGQGATGWDVRNRVGGKHTSPRRRRAPRLAGGRQSRARGRYGGPRRAWPRGGLARPSERRVHRSRDASRACGGGTRPRTVRGMACPCAVEKAARARSHAGARAGEGAGRGTGRGSVAGGRGDEGMRCAPETRRG